MLGVASVVTILLSVLVGYFVLTNHESQSILKQDAMPVAFRGPARRDGVIFVSDGAKGIARESSLELAKLGYHVLVGVKSEEEKRSFAFESRKGLEVILFDVAEPATLVTLVYRLQQIRRDLDRPMVGVVINLADFIEDHLAESGFIDIELLEINYKSLVKGPTRLLQSMLELVRHQAMQDDERNGVAVSQASSSTSSTSSANKQIGSGNVTMNAGGMRVVALAGELEESSATICGSKCALQSGFLDLLDSFRSDDHSVSNISLSTVHTALSAAVVDGTGNSTVRGPSIKNKRYRRGGTQGAKHKVYGQQLLSSRLKAIQQYVVSHKGHGGGGGPDSLDVAGLSGNSDKMSFGVRALVHAMASPRPRTEYQE